MAEALGGAFTTVKWAACQSGDDANVPDARSSGEIQDSFRLRVAR